MPFISAAGGGGTSIPRERVFVNNADRDAWTTLNSAILEAGQDQCVVLDPLNDSQFYVWTGSEWSEIDHVYQGIEGQKGDDGESVVSAAFAGNDIVFTLSDSSTIALPNAVLELQGDSVASAAFVDSDMVFYDDEANEIGRVVDAVNTLTGARGQSFFVEFSRTQSGPWSALFDGDPVNGSFYWRFSYDNKATWTDPQPCRQLTTVNIENPITINMGNLQLSSAGDSIALYNEERGYSAYPIGTTIYDDGTFLRSQDLVPTGPQVDDFLLGGNPDGSIVDCDYDYISVDSAWLMCVKVLPMETYTGKINVDVYSNAGSLISREVQSISVTAGQGTYLELKVDPKQVAIGGRTYRTIVAKVDDGLLPLKVQGNDGTAQNPVGPHRLVTYIPLAYRQNIAQGDSQEIIDEINGAPVDQLINADKVGGLFDAIQNAAGTPRGNIDFSGDLTQFSPANKGDYWTVNINTDSEILGDITFRNGDRLTAIQNITTAPATLNSAAWQVDPNTVPQASPTVTGGVKVSTSSAVSINSSTGAIDVKDATTTQKGVAVANAVGGFPVIESSGKISDQWLPADTGTITTETSTEAGLTSSFAQSEKAYLVYVNTTKEQWFLPSNTDPTDINNWTNRGTAQESVISFNSRKGDVTPQASDYDADMIDETVDRVFMTPAQSTKLDLYNETARYAEFDTGITYEKGDRVKNSAGYIIEANKQTPANAVPIAGDWDIVSYDYNVITADAEVGKGKAHMSYVVPSSTGAVTLTLDTAFPNSAHSYDVYINGNRNEGTKVTVALSAGVTAGGETNADGYEIKAPFKLEVRCDATQVNVTPIYIGG